MNKSLTFTIQINVFEAGVLVSTIWQSNNRDSLKNVFKQLLEISKKLREEAGVKVEYLGNGRVKITDKDGNTIYREMYEWEKTGEFE